MEYNLSEHGFQIIKDALPKDFFKSFHDSCYWPSVDDSKTEDIFDTEFGPKQIQNLHTIENLEARTWYLNFATKLKEILRIHGDVLNMQMFIKYPEYKITYPHQDGAYFDNPNRKIITFWVPLQDVSENNSCMFYVPASHKNGLIPHEPIGSRVRTRTGKTGYSLGCNEYPLESFVEAKMSLGDVLVHNQLTVHYSSQNKTNTPRLALTCIIEIK